MQGTNNKGQILIIVMLIMSALLMAGVLMTRAILSEQFMINMFINKQKAYYLAEAGIEDAKVLILNNPNWFTDNPHTPDDDSDWIIYLSTGCIKKLGSGSYKIVRESGKNAVYSVGFIGKNMEQAKARSLIRLQDGKIIIL
jgi:hypothetical protein